MALWCSAFLLLLTGCNPPYPRGGTQAALAQAEAELRQRSVDGQTLVWAHAGEASATTPILFIHGTPGDWQAWAEYLNHPALDEYSPLMAVNRPGWGVASEPIETDLQRQATLFAELLPERRRSIVVGHSLGAPIATWMAIDYPQRVCGVVLVAGSMAPALEGMRWYNELATWQLLQPLIPDPLLASNREIEALASELEQLEQAWPRLQRPVIALQGMEDELVDPRTADYLQQVAPAQWLEVKRFPDHGHFLLWESPQLVTDAINDLRCDNPV